MLNIELDTITTTSTTITRTKYTTSTAAIATTTAVSPSSLSSSTTTTTHKTLSTTPKNPYRRRTTWIHHCLWMYLVIGFCSPKCKSLLAIRNSQSAFNPFCRNTQIVATQFRGFFSFQLFQIKHLFAFV